MVLTLVSDLHDADDVGQDTSKSAPPTGQHSRYAAFRRAWLRVVKCGHDSHKREWSLADRKRRIPMSLVCVLVPPT
jgi:hypothetical protein